MGFDEPSGKVQLANTGLACDFVEGGLWAPNFVFTACMVPGCGAAFGLLRLRRAELQRAHGTCKCSPGGPGPSKLRSLAAGVSGSFRELGSFKWRPPNHTTSGFKGFPADFY